MFVTIRPVLAALALCLAAGGAAAAPLTFVSHSGIASAIYRFNTDPAATTASDSTSSPLDLAFSVALGGAALPPNDNTISAFGSAGLTSTPLTNTLDFTVGLFYDAGTDPVRGSGGASVNSQWTFTLDVANVEMTYSLNEDLLSSVSNGLALFTIQNLTTATTLFTLADDSTTASPVTVNFSGTIGDTISMQYVGIAQRNSFSASSPDFHYLHQSTFVFAEGEAPPTASVAAPGSLALLLAGLVPAALLRRRSARR